MTKKEFIKKSHGYENTNYESDNRIFTRLLEYCKYLYEDEKERRDILDNTMKKYLTVLGFIIGVIVLKVAGIDKLITLINNISIVNPLGKYIKEISSLFFFLSGGLFCLSFIFIFLVIKIWRRERLCNPEHILNKSISITDENRLLSKIISDYAVATNRNYNINERKANLLSKALLSLIGALIIFLSTWIFLLIVSIWR